MSYRYQELLRGYSDFLRRAGHNAAAEMALRSQSRAVRDVIAYVASYNRFTAADLKEKAKNGTLPSITYRYDWLATLGRVCALQAFNAQNLEEHQEDINFGQICLEHANKKLPRERPYQHFHRLEIELLARAGRLDEARALIHAFPLLKSTFYGYLLVDLENPSATGSSSTYSSWLEGFNRQFTENNIATIIEAPPEHSFNDLVAEEQPPQSGGPKVSVVMTSFEPSQEDLETAVRSIIAQTYINFELLIVDDASPKEFDETLRYVSSIDPRIRVLKQTKNGGTYRARNAGFAAATGDYITGQDSDDWSHPARLAHQVSYLQNNPSSPGVVVQAVRMNNDLIRTFPGRLPDRLCEVSLMLRRSDALDAGGYIDARKGADSEFRRRLERIAGKPVGEIDKPLYLTRIGHDSLSAADFKPGWSHPVRRAFWNATQYWHDNATRAELHVSKWDSPPIPIPQRFQVDTVKSSPPLDVIFLGDWRSYGRVQRTMADEMDSLSSAGMSVGVLQLESILSPSKEPTRLCEEIQSRIHHGKVQEVLPDDNEQPRLIIIHDPAILQFLPEQGINISAELTLVVADVAPESGDGETPVYIPHLCDQKARQVFGGEVIWSSIDPDIRTALELHSAPLHVDEKEVPLVFDVAHWTNSRHKLSQGLPIVGRHADNFEALWPDEKNDTNLLWPADESVEVHILGDARAQLRRLSQRSFPHNWVVFRDKEITPRAFMRNIDFYIYKPSDRFVQSYCREAFEAVSSGSIAILPHRFKRVHGTTAIYAHAHEVPSLLEYYSEDEGEFERIRQRASSSLSEVDRSADFVEFVSSLQPTYGTKFRENHALS